MGLPRQMSLLLWYYGSNRDTTTILIPCQSLSLTAKTSWTYRPWLSTSTVYCIACWYNGQWWLRNITEMLYDQDDVKVTFTHKCGPASTFCWPHWENICWSRQKASSVVDICTITGRNYTVSSDTESLMIKLQKNLTRCRHKLRKLVVISRTLNAFFCNSIL